MSNSLQPLIWQFACPLCQTVLDASGCCPVDGRAYKQVDGIWRFLPPERAVIYAQFVREYEAVRRAEGRGCENPAYYQSLPFTDLSGTMTEMWQLRAHTFQTMLAKILEPLTAQKKRPLRIIDMGAGNGWLSHQLSLRGHTVAAIDLSINQFDGLGTHQQYDVPFTPIQAEFDHLPLAPAQADLVIFNASFHYSSDYSRTVQEAWRALASDGCLLISDTPVYHNKQSGRQMVREREAHFVDLVGFPSNSLSSQNFLTYQDLPALGTATASKWELHWPIPRWRRFIRRLRAALHHQREPAQFPLIVGRKSI